ncbi:CTK1 [[Candida] subhashii]|uniref:CTK1 n=1 Tax=[Candida] subhashii TaxID=561895 RepID=A0A8J5UWU4_9ASCO|nr:CTK1 [[Candida] subhashii]KAG7663260.1 CTK1 [[Candida] subhashii]
MSDRYRPPPKGPRSTRDFHRPGAPGAPPSGPSSQGGGNTGGGGYRTTTSSSSSYKDRDYYVPPAPRRYGERDNYRPDTYKPPPRGPKAPAPTGTTTTTTTSSSDSSSSVPSIGAKAPSTDRNENRNERNDERGTSRSGSGLTSGIKRSLPSGPSSYRKRREVDEYSQYRGGSGYSNGPGPSTIRLPPKGPRRIGNSTTGGGYYDERSSFIPEKSKLLKQSQIYSIRINKAPSIYQRIQQVGEGTYGKVYKAKHTQTNEYVAMKRLRLETEREGFPITAIREIKLLSSFDHENVVGLLEMMVEHNQIYMIFDYLDHDLTGLLSHPDLKLSECHRKFIFKQLIQGLNYLHKKRVIHRDIKGSNILIDNIGRLKIADFGLARTMKILNTGESPDYTNRVITIWYRPPELLLGATDYGREVDIWGVGCLLIELYCKNAIFQGYDEVNQLFKIFSIMGTPTLKSWPEIEKLPWFEMLKPKINVVNKFKSKYESLMTRSSFDLAEKLLELNPKNRPTAEEALQHAYFKEDPQPEPLMFLKELKGEWHEFETKKQRRKERKRLQEEEAKINKLNKSLKDDIDSDAKSEKILLSVSTTNNT